nr:TRAP transporter small permease [uncultured Azospirillum sp.]
MHEPIGLPDRPPTDGLSRVLLVAARGFALAGGGIFLALVGMSLLSILGRKLANLPVTGDVEMMQVGTAVAACAFLPLCTILGENLRVDFFTEAAPAWLRRLLDAVADLLLGALVLLLVWRTGLQTIDIREAGEVTPLLGLPVWIPMAAMLPSLVLTALCALARCRRGLTSAQHLTAGTAEVAR